VCGEHDGVVLTAHNHSPQYVNLLYNHGSGSNIASNYRMERYAFYLSQGGVRLFVYDYAG
jgi:hypothetical protein